MTRIGRDALARVVFALVAAIVIYPSVRLFDWLADAFYRPKDVKGVEDCVARLCRMGEDHCDRTKQRSWKSRIRRAGFHRYGSSISFEQLRDEFRRSPSACRAWMAVSEDIRYETAWAVGQNKKGGYRAVYRHNDPARRQKYFYETQEEACARFLLGFLGRS